MKPAYQHFLEALRAALAGGSVSWEAVGQEELEALFSLAEEQQLLPMVYEAVYRCPVAQAQGKLFLAPYRQKVIQAVTRQAVKTAEFLPLLQRLQQAGLHPLVVKGVVCRSLYPWPDHRPSGDEDLLLPPGEADACHRLLLEEGLALSNEQADLSAHEVAYGKAGSPLYLEVHRALFPPESEAYGDLNRYFEGVFERAVTVEIDGVSVPTMEPDDHLFYLLCHALKHFLHSGFGLRQVCDMCLFAERYGSELDWDALLDKCRAIRAERFAAAIFRIGQNRLGFDPARAGMSEAWTALSVDETALLEDLLGAGVHGSSSMSRKHSSSITLQAAAAQKQGKKPSGLLSTVFPPAQALASRYPYLKDKPYLLPLAWGSRLVNYQRETASQRDDSAGESLRIGKERVALLRQYGIVEK